MDTNRKIVEIKKELSLYRKELFELKKAHDKKSHFIRIKYVWLVPEKELFNKQEALAERLGDWSNFAKIYDDVIFNDFLGIDDSQVKRGSVDILQSRDENHYVAVNISLQPMAILKEWALGPAGEERLSQAMQSSKKPKKPESDPVIDYLTEGH